MRGKTSISFSAHLLCVFTGIGNGNGNPRDMNAIVHETDAQKRIASFVILNSSFALYFVTLSTTKEPKITEKYVANFFF